MTSQHLQDSIFDRGEKSLSVCYFNTVSSHSRLSHELPADLESDTAGIAPSSRKMHAPK
jgi:hypothetical protein